jgi:ATP-dependent Lon protease|uniref:Lon proteolytic domain-containing protein n=1 Tax=viral metagenome TaxID=1070528 RepID=A0A6C0ISY2_9ZZZZ
MTDDGENIGSFIEDKTTYIQQIIRKTIIAVVRHNTENLFSNSDTKLAIPILNNLYTDSETILRDVTTQTESPQLYASLDRLQKIINNLSMIICGFGTQDIEDLLFIIFGSEFKDMSFQDEILQAKYELIKQHVRPYGYKVIHWNKKKRTTLRKKVYCEDKITDSILEVEQSSNLECYELEEDNEHLYKKMNGIRITIQNEKTRKTLVINGIIDNIHIHCFTNKYIKNRVDDISSLYYSRQKHENEIIKEMIEAFTVKDILIHGKNDVLKKTFSIMSEVNSLKQSKLETTFKRFLELDTYMKCSMIMNLLLSKDPEVQYICYLLYELLALDQDDLSVATTMYNILPWKFKTKLDEMIKVSSKKSDDITKKYEVSQISIEQQIYLMKAPENVKEKAMLKLKEIKGRPDEGSLKAKQYIEGLLKLPFGVYRQEPILKKVKDFNKVNNQMVDVLTQHFPNLNMKIKNQRTILEIYQNIKQIRKCIIPTTIQTIVTTLKQNTNKSRAQVVQHINNIMKEKGQKRLPMNQPKQKQVESIQEVLNNATDIDIYEIYDKTHEKTNDKFSLKDTYEQLVELETNVQDVETEMDEVMDTMEKSIYGHARAKSQIMKIIGQWMNGKLSGYCFGFEGSPGIGKTSLAKKGISKCLKNDDGETRPFSFIALGGSANGSTIEGHSYTYMNSTWGKVVEILMDSKCMNPIIYIDELDKVSKTEHGKEIIGILTHMIDSTQNDSFQDKYFSGIDIDLSKALFIFSYNDPEQIDRILLDRIHRIKFDNLSLEDKMVIVKDYILPEINDKMGFEDVVDLSDTLIQYIIENYTLEPGVRKLKEILFDMYGEINLEILKVDTFHSINIPLQLTEYDIDKKYLKNYKKVNDKLVHSSPEKGVINGLWANTLGHGGIIPIQCMLFPSSNFLELRLTGLQGDVMKESMNVAKTLAWDLTSEKRIKALLKQFAETKKQGLHIHCPEGAISKDGPSAGTAITVAIYSIFNNKEIKHDIAITGEINLQGQVTPIGGLDVKIVGGIKAGVKTFLYPKGNERDFEEWKTNNKKDVDDIQFIGVSNIKEVFKYVFVN